MLVVATFRSPGAEIQREHADTLDRSLAPGRRDAGRARQSHLRRRRRFRSRLGRCGSKRGARGCDRRAQQRHPAASLRALARTGRERRGRDFQRAGQPRHAGRGASRIAPNRRARRAAHVAPLARDRRDARARRRDRPALRAAAPRRRGPTRPERSRRLRRSGGRDRDARGAARAGARLPLHARARPSRDLRPDHDVSAARSCTSESATRSNARTPTISRMSCPSLRTTSRSLLPSQAQSAASTTTSAPPAAATATFAYGEAAARLSSALELGIADPGERARVQVELGNLLWLTGRIAEAEAILTASLDAAAGLEERGLAARALVHLSSARLSSDPAVGPAEMVSIAEEAIRTFEQLDDPLASRRPSTCSVRRTFATGGPMRAWRHATEPLRTRMPPGIRSCYGRSSADCSDTLCDGSTPAEEAIERIEELRSSSRNDPVLDAGLRRALALVLAMAGRFDEAREHILVSSAVLDSADQTQLSIQTRWAVAEAKALTGDLCRRRAGIRRPVRRHARCERRGIGGASAAGERPPRSPLL